MKNILLGLFVLFSSFLFSQSCLHTIQRTDTFGDGWNGATYTLTNSAGAVVSTGTLATISNIYVEQDPNDPYYFVALELGQFFKISVTPSGVKATLYS